MTHIYDTISTDISKYNKRRFTYKYQVIILNDDGEVIKDKKYCTTKDAAEDNDISSYQVITRIANGYEFNSKFNKYKNIQVYKIHEKKKTRTVTKRILIDED